MSSWKDHLMEQEYKRMEEGTYNKSYSSSSKGQWIGGQWKNQYEIEEENRKLEYNQKANKEYDGRFRVGKVVKHNLFKENGEPKDYGIIKSVSKVRDWIEVQWISTNKVMKVYFNSEIKVEVLYSQREYDRGIPDIEKYSIYMAQDEYDDEPDF